MTPGERWIVKPAIGGPSRLVLVMESVGGKVRTRLVGEPTSPGVWDRIDGWEWIRRDDDEFRI